MHPIVIVETKISKLCRINIFDLPLLTPANQNNQKSTLNLVQSVKNRVSN